MLLIALLLTAQATYRVNQAIAGQRAATACFLYIVNVKVFSFSPFSRIFSKLTAWKFLFNLVIFRKKILGFLKTQSGITDCLRQVGLRTSKRAD